MFGKLTKIGRLMLLGFALLLLGLALLGIQIFLKVQSGGVGKKSTVENGSTQTQNAQVESQYWQTYINPEYMFSIDHPRFLTPLEIKGQGGYVFFVRFEENNFSQGKGVAIGVSDRTLEGEVDAVKKEIEGGIESKLSREEQTAVGDLTATRLDYVPVNPNQGEPRSIAVLNNGKYSFSVSTTPEQVDAVLASLKFLGTFDGCKELLKNEGAPDFLRSYCSGEACSQQTTKEACERLDVIKIQESGLSEDQGRDGIADCVWVESNSSQSQCKPRY